TSPERLVEVDAHAGDLPRHQVGGDGFEHGHVLDGEPLAGREVATERLGQLGHDRHGFAVAPRPAVQIVDGSQPETGKAALREAQSGPDSASPYRGDISPLSTPLSVVYPTPISPLYGVLFSAILALQMMLSDPAAVLGPNSHGRPVSGRFFAV